MFTPAGAQSRVNRTRARPRANVASQPAVPPIAGPPSYSYGSPTNASPRTATLRQTQAPLSRQLSSATKHSQYIDSIVEIASEEEEDDGEEVEEEVEEDEESIDGEENTYERAEEGSGVEEADESEHDESTFAHVKSRARLRDRLEDVEASINRRRSLRSASRSTGKGSPERPMRQARINVSQLDSTELSIEEDAALAQLDYTTRLTEDEFDQTEIDQVLSDAPPPSSAGGLPQTQASLFARAQSTLAFGHFLARRLLSMLTRLLIRHGIWLLVPVLLAALSGLVLLGKGLPNPLSQVPHYAAPVRAPGDVAEYASRLHALERIVQDLGHMQSSLELKERSDLGQLSAHIDGLRRDLGAQNEKLEELEQRFRQTASATDAISDKLLDQLVDRLPERLATEIDRETGRVTTGPGFWQYLRDSLKKEDDSPYSWQHFLEENERNLKSFVDIQQDDRWRRAGQEGVVVSRAYFLDVLKQEMRSLASDLDGRLKSMNISLQQVGSNLAGKGLSGHAGLAIDQLVESAIERHSRDVLSRPDYSAYSSGARVDPFLTSTTYMHRPATPLGRLASTLLGNIGSSWSHPPAMALHQSISLGMCWAFPGASGQLAVSLSHPILLTDIALEHVHPDVAHDVSSAPRELEVWAHIGKDSVDAYAAATDGASAGGEHRREPPADGYVHLMDVVYNVYAGESMVQTFPVPASFRRLNVPSDRVLLRFKTNWGNDRFTCIYRVRTMGVRPLAEAAAEDESDEHAWADDLVVDEAL